MRIVEYSDYYLIYIEIAFSMSEESIKVFVRIRPSISK